MFNKKTVGKFLVAPVSVGVLGLNVISSSPGALVSAFSESEIKQAADTLFSAIRGEQLKRIQQDLNEDIAIKVEENKVKFERKGTESKIFFGKAEYTLPERTKCQPIYLTGASNYTTALNPNDLEFKLTKDDDSVLGISKVELVNTNTGETVLNLKKSFLINSWFCFGLLRIMFQRDVNMNQEVVMSTDNVVDWCTKVQLPEGIGVTFAKLTNKLPAPDRLAKFSEMNYNVEFDWHSNLIYPGGYCDSLVLRNKNGKGCKVRLLDENGKQSVWGINLDAYQLNELKNGRYNIEWNADGKNRLLTLSFQNGSKIPISINKSYYCMACFWKHYPLEYFMYFLDNC